MKLKFLAAAFIGFVTAGITISCDKTDFETYKPNSIEFALTRDSANLSNDTTAFWETADIPVDSSEYRCYEFYNNKMKYKDHVMRQYATYRDENGQLYYARDAYDMMWTINHDIMSWIHDWGNRHVFYLRGLKKADKKKNSVDTLKLEIVNGTDSLHYYLVRGNSCFRLPRRADITMEP